MLWLNLFSHFNFNLLAVTNVSNFWELLQFPFMQRAIAGGILMGLLGGLLGSFVTLRQLSFYSHAVGHSALVGIILGVLLQLNPTWMLLPFTLIFGVVVLYLIDRTELASDTILNVLLSGTLAIGIILSSLIRGYRGGLMNVLFGDILAVSQVDLILTCVLLFSSAIYLLSTLKEQVLLTLNLSVAKVQGIPVQLHRYLFVVLLSLTVALATKAIGILLVNAFLVIPAASAKLLSQKFRTFLTLSIILGALSSIMGIFFSGLFNWPSGPSIVLVQFSLFLVVAGLTQLRMAVK
ncbi:metal ABC transporter permease [Aerosakkonemataceae cyanobacterium BLCC-F154]|uniref:Metal ABC transporter permease n=1 Tax=Floridaenema fluviatile BLCC-F154 TaxID=3153640 RepID=A0ABV4Y5F4_9CYAN